MLKDILYIDDSILDLHILKRLHDKYHCFNSCETTEDPITALDQLRIRALNNEGLPDIIFLDLKMPLFDGYQFLDQFENIYPQFHKDIWIHILTSSTSLKDIVRCMQYPHVKYYHVKPIAIETLLHNENLH